MENEIKNLLADKIAGIIKKERQARGWSRYQLAKRSNVDAGHLMRIEKGLLCPQIDTLHKLCCALQIQLQIPLPI